MSVSGCGSGSSSGSGSVSVSDVVSVCVFVYGVKLGGGHQEAKSGADMFILRLRRATFFALRLQSNGSKSMLLGLVSGMIL